MREGNRTENPRGGSPGGGGLGAPGGDAGTSGPPGRHRPRAAEGVSTCRGRRYNPKNRRKSLRYGTLPIPLCSLFAGVCVIAVPSPDPPGLVSARRNSTFPARTSRRGAGRGGRPGKPSRSPGRVSPFWGAGSQGRFSLSVSRVTRVTDSDGCFGKVP